ncbi:MAG: hypothetical protein JO021_13885 [Alphaproteobacteria bacterium]|nr:hypothetical protein [Alphaproteobacteria bacterium]
MTITSITSTPYESSILGTWTVPGGASDSTDATSTDATSTDGTTPAVVAADPLDSIHLSQIQTAGSFTAEGADSYRVADLFKITQAKDAPLTSVSVAIRGPGTLTLDGVDVTNQLTFTEDEFKNLVMTVGANVGDETDIVMAASTTSGSSPAMEIDAQVTGTRSINAAPALFQQDNFTFVAQRAFLMRGYFPDQDPDLTTAGNFTGEAGDTFKMSDLFHIEDAQSAPIASVSVALRGPGTLTLDGVDVTNQLSFTEDEFNRLQFNIGASGDSTDIVVAASTAKGSSQALEITGAATGTRSINAAPALYQQDAFTFVAQRAALMNGYIPDADPGLTSVGNFTSQTGDTYKVSQLFDVTNPKAGPTTEVDVAIRGAGTLTLDGVDVTGETEFTLDEFKRLQFQLGSNANDTTDIVVAAATAHGSSLAQAITATASGVRSINAAPALYDQDNFTFVAQRASLLRGFFPDSDPSLATVGNFTAQSGDLYKVSDLYTITQAKSATITTVDVAVRGAGTLLLDGVDVTGQTHFTEDEFKRLQLQVGSNPGDAADLVVAATTQTGASQALSLTATVGDKRSINAAPALYQQDSYSFVAQRAFLMQGFIPDADPSLTTSGNFTSEVGDTYRLSDLYRIDPAKSAPVSAVNVALRGPGTLTLDGVDVTNQLTFTPDQFNRLQFSAGSALGDETDIVVAVSTAKGSSPAIQITGSITGKRSINAASGLYQQDNFTFVAQRAFLVRGNFPSNDPGLAAIGTPDTSALSAGGLGAAPGSYIGTGLTFDSHQSFNYAALFTNALGGADASGQPNSDIRTQLLELLSMGSSQVGGVQMSSRTGVLSPVAIMAYLQALKLR